MGRSSGGSRSGGFRGGRSSGGFSGSGRSSRNNSSYSRPRNTGFSHSRNNWGHVPRIHHYGRPRIYTRGYAGGGGIGFAFGIICFFIIMMLLFASSSINTSTTNNIKNTKERTKLMGVVNKTEWYDDQIGWISSRNVLISGLEDFYNQTGIQPYVLFVPYSPTYWNGSTLNANVADNYLEQVYNNNFSDEAHFIFAYFECYNDSKSEMNGEFRYLSGYSADTIMDNEAINILWGYFEKNYYNTSLSIEKMISNTFSETAKAIMSKPTNFWDFAKIAIIVVAIIVVCIIVYHVIKSKHQREKEKEKYKEEILSKPLETFGNDTSELEDKYK